MRITTWNVNSVRLRTDHLPELLRIAGSDVLCLQETKVVNDGFPLAPFEALGFRHHVLNGQKSHHGVAILSRLPFKPTSPRAWCDKNDCRHLAVTLPGGLELHNFYVPAGGDIPDPEANAKFAHKLAFLREMADWFGARQKRNARRILVGDLNVAPLESDVWSHKQLLSVVSHTPIEVALLAKVMAAHDWYDAVRHFVPPERKLYTWWSYRARDWANADRGRRLDHIWVTEPLKARLASISVHKPARDWAPPSDHVPVTLEIADE